MQEIKVGNTIDLQIERLSFTGKGIARVDNFVIFVPHTLPGDQVSARIVKLKRRYADGKVVEFKQRSDMAIEPQCHHFGVCGGCSFQNLPYPEQLNAKREAIYEHLRRIGKIEEPPLADVIGAENIFYYRNKMEFSFIPDSDHHLKLGLHHRGEWEKIFDVERCLLQSEKSNRIIEFARDFFRKRKVPAYHISEHHGYLRFLIIRQSRASGEIMLILVTNRGDLDCRDEFIAEINESFPEVASIAHVVNATKANIATGEEPVIIYGADYITEKIGEKSYHIRPTSFFQTNSAQTEVLYHRIVELGDFRPDERVLDLYTGCGTIAIYIADRVKSVLGIELNPDAIKSADENAQLNNVDNNCRFIAGDVRKTLHELVGDGQTADSVIVDPPRAGIGRKVIHHLVKMDPRKIVYVSCNPATLAEDVHELGRFGFRLEKTVPVDMFPHTFHIETVSRLTREESF